MTPLEYLRELNKAAEVEIEPSKPLKWYLRSTELVFKQVKRSLFNENSPHLCQACVYYSESDHEKAYVLFMKFSNLILSQLPRHPEFNKTEHADTKAKLKSNCLRAIEILERLRPVLEANFVAFLEEKKRAQEATAEAEKQRLRQEAQLSKLKEIQAQMELEAAAKKTIEAATLAPAIAYALPTEPSIDHTINASTVSDGTTTIENSSHASTVSDGTSTIDINSHGSTIDNSSYASTINNGTYASTIDNNSHASTVTSTISAVSPARKGARFFSESGRPLRPVHVPASIIETFLSLAAENTRRNIETCGVIAGKLHQDEFTITCLIVPKQHGTSDTCSMTNEEEIVEAQDRLDVMSLGWIHTHPTQSCFLSSVDLHTHMPFQMLMEEAIAIVCAPSKTPNFGIFRLTDPPGLDLINKCPKSGGSFHPHPENIQIYRELRGPEAHAQIQAGLPFEIIDMRFK